MKSLILVIFIFGSSLANANVWQYIKFGKTDADNSPCSKSDEFKTIPEMVESLKKNGTALEQPCSKISDMHLRCQSRNSANATEYFLFPSKHACEQANQEYKRSSNKLGKYMDDKKDVGNPSFKNTNYFWNKLSSGSGCIELKTDAKMFRMLCHETSSDANKLSLDCSKVPDMTMQQIDLYSSEQACDGASD